MNVTVIINPVSGRQGHHARAQARASLAQGQLAARGLQVEAIVTERPRHAHALALAAVTAGAELVVAWGGDGTVNEVASALAGTRARLGIVPGGSGNGLARDLGIPLDPRATLDVLVDGRDRVIDGWVLDGRPFFNVAGIGLDARVAQAFQNHGGRGLVSYVGKTARALLAPVGTPCSIRTEGGTLDADALVVALANSRQYGNDVLIAPQARLDDGVIDIVVIPRMSVARLLWRVPRLLAGRIHEVPGVTVVRSATAAIESPVPLAYHVDGEPHIGGTRLEMTKLPELVTVRVPV